MNLSQFFKHWAIRENPFRGEEARNDEVFHRLRFVGEVAAPSAPDVALGSLHSDFEKILGELGRPSTSVVFGEKGSGKTAIKIQILARVQAHNARRPSDRLLVVPYDDLNPFLAELHERFGSKADPAAPFRKARLVDHIDAILALATTRLVAALMRQGNAPDRAPAASPAPSQHDPAHHRQSQDPAEPLLHDGYARALRAMPTQDRYDLLRLQALYDTAPGSPARTLRMRRLLRLPPRPTAAAEAFALAVGWVPATLFAALALLNGSSPIALVAAALALAYLALLAKRFALDPLRLGALAARVRAEMRAIPRPPRELAAALLAIEPQHRAEHDLPAADAADQPRYRSLHALRRALARLGYSGLLVIIDRVDEPTLIHGDPEKMRALIWPLFNNKFLQQEGLGVKMLLPIELRHALFRESAQFFQEARLDKQGLVERLTWTGPMLYDLCNARLHACREPAAEPLALIDLFADDVTRADLVDALDQMHQPRDAFKLLYRCMNEHCASVTADQNAWRIPRLILDHARRLESDRVQALYRGIGPA